MASKTFPYSLDMLDQYEEQDIFSAVVAFDNSMDTEASKTQGHID
jgi:hypothetical protein